MLGGGLLSAKYRPDDSLSQRDQKGELNGVRRIKDALKKNNVTLGKGVITSRDTGMAAVRRDLKRTGLPPGVEHWQMPVVIGQEGDILCFISRLKPGTKVPEHAHEGIAVFRVILDGELRYGRKTLKTGDFILIPGGVMYEVQAGPQGCTIFYAHIPWPFPWPPHK
jgi:anti-sigma factor ChrR (cupin superfamily)